LNLEARRELTRNRDMEAHRMYVLMRPSMSAEAIEAIALELGRIARLEQAGAEGAKIFPELAPNESKPEDTRAEPPERD
jgi:hypothetical protein